MRRRAQTVGHDRGGTDWRARVTANRSAGDGEASEDGSDTLPTTEPVIETFEQFAERYGLNRSCGRIYGICCFADDPQSLDELVTKSGYAKSTVSTATQTLTRLSLLSRRSGEGGRRVSFRAETEITAIVQDLLRRRVARDLADLRVAVAEGRAQTKADGTDRQDSGTDDIQRNTPADFQADVERIEKFLEWIVDLPADQVDAVVRDSDDEDGGSETDRQLAPGFFPRLGQ